MMPRNLKCHADRLGESLRTRPGTRARLHWRRGVSVLEMAMVLPILLMLSFGMVDYGYYFFLKSTVQGAAQAGARAAIVPGSTSDSVTSAVSAIMTPAGLGTSSYTLTTTPTDMSTATSGTSITVTVSCTWGTVGYHTLPSVLGGIANTKQMSTTVTMRKE